MVVQQMPYGDKGKAPASSKRGLENNEEDAVGREKKPRTSVHVDASDCLPNDVKKEEIDAELRATNNAANRLSTFVVPKEEQIDEKEFERIIEERFQRHFGRLSSEEAANSLGECSYQPATSDQKIWKVKCTVGRERKLVFCLMQKYVYFTYIRKDLHIISAFTIDRIKGFIFIEADKECYAYEACKSFDGLYCSKLEELSEKEFALLLSTIRQEPSSIRDGMSVRVTNGSYKGDIGEVWNVNKKRTHAVVKLVPRIDLKELSQKFAGEKFPLKLVTPASKLISSSELAEFGSHVKELMNRSTGEAFQVLDGLMLKDGYLFKKIPLDSLSTLSSSPPCEGLFKSECSDEQNLAKRECLNELFPIPIDDEESETPVCKPENKFELGELVFWGRNTFGLVIGIEVGNTYKILKNEPEGHIVITIEESFLKHGPSCARFSAFDMNKKGVFIDDCVRVSEGIFKEREGVVEKVYNGILFICDKSDASENGGYFCCKALRCEKLNNYHNDLSSSNTLRSQSESTKTPHRSRENSNSRFFVGQRLRIKVGPLKGHLCSFLAKHQSDVTVRLDTKQKKVKVKLEHLCEVPEKNSSLLTEEFGNRNSGTNDVEWNTEAKQLTTNNPSWDMPALNNDTETGWNEGTQFNHNSSWNDGRSKKNDNGWSAEANPSWEAPSSSWKTSEGWHETTHVDHYSLRNDESSKKNDSGWSTENNNSWNALRSSSQNSERGWNESSEVDKKSLWNRESSKKSDSGWNAETNTSWNAPNSSWENSKVGVNEATNVVHNSSWNDKNSKKNESGWCTETNNSWNAPSSVCQNGERGWNERTEVDHQSSWHQESSNKNDNGWSTETKTSWNTIGTNEATNADHNSWNEKSSKKNYCGWNAQASKSWNALRSSSQNSERGWNESTRVDHKSSWNQENSKENYNRWSKESKTSWNTAIPSWKNGTEDANGAINVDISHHVDAPVENNDQTNRWGRKGNLAEKYVSEECSGWGKAPNADDSTKESGWKRWRNVDEVAATSYKVDSNLSVWNAPNSSQDNQGLTSWKSGSSGQNNAPTIDGESKNLSSWDTEVTVDDDETVGWGRKKESSFGEETAANNDSRWNKKGKGQGNWGSNDKECFTNKNNGRGKCVWNSNASRGSFKSNFGDNNGGNCSWGRVQKGSAYGKSSRNYNGGESWKADGNEKQSMWNKGETENRSLWGKQENEKEGAVNEWIGRSSSWGNEEGSKRGEGSSKNSDNVWDKAADEWGIPRLTG